jgi:hypothetical protein
VADERKQREARDGSVELAIGEQRGLTPHRVEQALPAAAHASEGPVVPRAGEERMSARAALEPADLGWRVRGQGRERARDGEEPLTRRLRGRLAAAGHVVPMDAVGVQGARDVTHVVSRGQSQPELPIARVRKARVVQAHDVVTRPPHERARVRDGVEREQIDECVESPTHVVRAPGCALAEGDIVLVDEHERRIHEADLWMRVERRDLARDRVGAQRVVVRIEDPDELAPRHRESLVVREDAAPVRLVEHDANARVGRVACDDLATVVRGAVVDDDDLDRGIGLPEQRVDRARQVPAVVVVRHYERDARRASRHRAGPRRAASDVGAIPPIGRALRQLASRP